MYKQTELTGKIQTVQGLVDADDLGVTLPHEHILWDLSCYFVKPGSDAEVALAYQPVMFENLSWIRYNGASNLDNLRLRDEEVAIRELLLYKQAGGNAIVEVTPIGVGRDPAGLVRIAQATGLKIIMGTSYYIDIAHPPGLDTKTEAQIADEFVRDLTVGVDDSGVCAGIIGEIGCSWPWTEDERKVVAAAASAQRRTGAALMIHPGRNELAPLEIIEMLRGRGADLSRIVICHADRTLLNFEDRRKVVEAGCYLEFDLFMRQGYFDMVNPSLFPPDVPDDLRRIDYIAELIAAGYLNQILMSQDIATKIRLTRYGGAGYAHILRHVVPLMQRKGITDEHIHTMLVENPKRMLQFAATDIPPAN